MLYSYNLRKLPKRKPKITNPVKNDNKDDNNIKQQPIVTTIPKILHCTHYNKNIIPQKVWDNIKKYAPDYELRFYDDDDCRSFLNEHYGESHVDKFNSLQLGAHKADFFRYCLLYQLGGVYMDIDMEPKKHFNKIFDHSKKYGFYSVLGSSEDPENFLQRKTRRLLYEGNGHIFQALIGTYPKNPLMLNLTEDFFTVPNPEVRYDVFTYIFYDKLRDLIGKPLLMGENFYLNNKKSIILYGEFNLGYIPGEELDRYGGLFHVVDNDNNILVRSRYADYPWDK